MKTKNSTIIGLALLGITNTTEAKTDLQIEALAEVPLNQPIIRASALPSLPAGIDSFAFVDFYGRESGAFYSEANVGRELYKTIDPKVEWNGGSGMDDVFRIGGSIKPKIIDDLFLEMKAYPLTLASNGNLLRTSQLSLFGRLDLPKEVYLEDWTDTNIDWNNPKKPLVASELTLGKTLVDNLALEVQGAYNVNIPGLQARAGLRYNF